MTTPNEELILKLRGQAYTTCRPDQLCDQAADLLQSLAERIAELEKEVEAGNVGLHHLRAKNVETRAERDTLRAELAEIAATEPVAKLKPCKEGWFIDLDNPPPITGETIELFTRPMPALDMTELVEVLEMIVSTHQGHCEHHVGVSKHSYNLADIAEEALSKYKGAK